MPNLISSLTNSLSTPVAPSLRDEIIKNLWPDGASASPNSTSPRPDGPNWVKYFELYREECEAALSDEGRYFVPRTHHDILNVIRLLADDLSQDDIRNQIQQASLPQTTPGDQLKKLNISIMIAR
ncbi:hypothetical protein E8E11_006123 [Didymella keratinophila]|nr:hypothetical protein E8E11_006123 [Didymella keratinophila]